MRGRFSGADGGGSSLSGCLAPPSATSADLHTAEFPPLDPVVSIGRKSAMMGDDRILLSPLS